MAGAWTIVIWVLVTVVFLVRNRAVAGFLSRLSRQPRHIQGAVLVVTILATIQAFEKSTNETEMVTIEQTALPSSASSFIPQPSSFSTSSLPAFWHDDATDTDEDGIPDLWEKWTHGNRTIADGDIDRDEDGLTDLEEFQNQTDPRTADTDGDGFSDSFEVANGMNPVVSEDFTPIEPDTNNNGLPDIWEQAGYGPSFQDADHDGFDDAYEMYYLPAASDANFDVLVDVYSTRSAALVWDNGNFDDSGCIVILPTTGTSVKIRLPFDADTELKLLPAPEGTDPPSGELWKSRIGMTFAPRTGQNTAGTCIVASTGDISQKVVGLESVITRFPETEAMQVFALDGGSVANGNPGISILRKRFEITPQAAVYHAVGDVVGPFSITNIVNIDEDEVQWAERHGSGVMSPQTGYASMLTVVHAPPFEESLVVEASLHVDGLLVTNRIAIVTRCPYHDFSLDSYTANFSPHLGETLDVGVTLPGCGHSLSPGWLEIEVVRETIGAIQRVASVDMDPGTPAVDRYLDTSALGGQSLLFEWDGIAQESLSLANHPDIFTGTNGWFYRAMPAVVAGEPVPPPFYTLAARLWNTDKSEVLAEETRRIYIPQVVNIVPFGGEDAFQEPIYTVGTNGLGLVTLYPGCTASGAEAALEQLPAMAMAFFPPDVNLRIVMTNTVAGRHKSVLIVAESSDEGRRGDASGFSSRNERPDGNMAIYIDGFQKSLRKSYDGMLAGNSDDISAPMTAAQFVQYIAPTVAHEVGHGLGLVDPKWLPATPNDKQKLHNKVQTWIKMMDMGGLYYVKHRLNPHPTDYWLPDNLRYLRFVLPKGE